MFCFVGATIPCQSPMPSLSALLVGGGGGGGGGCVHVCVCACVWPIWGHCFGLSGVRGCECVWPIWGPWLAGWSPRWSSPSSARGGGGGRVWRGVAPCQALSFTTLVSPWSTSFSFSLCWLTVWSFHLGLLRGDRQRIGSLLLPILVGHVLRRDHGGATSCSCAVVR